MSRFTRMKGISDERRLPRLGKIRLGLKVKSERSGAEHPREVDYFVVPPEVEAVYGPKPTRLDVMVAVEDTEVNFPVALKYYKASGLFCTGDGEVAIRRDEHGKMVEMACPCPFLESKHCKRTAVLNVVLHKVSPAGVYQILTSSWNSIVDVQSGLDYVRGMVGRVSWVPMVLERVANETSHTENGKTSKQTHYTLRLTMPKDATTEFINALRLETKRILDNPSVLRLPPPDINPVDDLPDLVEEDEVVQAGFKVIDSKPTATTAAPQAAPAAMPAVAPTTAVAAPAPAAPAAAPPPPKPPVAAKADIEAAWKCVQQIVGRGNPAKTFWDFFAGRYCGVKSSAEIPADRLQGTLVSLRRIAAITDPKERLNEWGQLDHLLRDELAMAGK